MYEPLVTIGYIIDEKSDSFVYTLNTILAQSYSKIELIISFDEILNISICDIIDCINSHIADNFINIKININKKKIGLKGNTNYIIEKGKGDFITFLINDDAFYNEKAIENIINKIQPDKKAIICGTAFFNNINEEYIFTEPNEQCSNIGEIKDSIVENLFVLYKRNFLLNRQCLNDCNYETEVKYILNELDKNSELQFYKEVCMRHTLYLKDPLSYRSKKGYFHIPKIENKKTNYSRSLFLKLFINYLKDNRIIDNRNTSLEIAKKIEQYIKLLIERQDEAYWGITEGDMSYIAFLYKLRKILMLKKFLRKILINSLFKKVNLIYMEKVKIVFFAQEFSVWSCLKSIYEEAIKDERFIAQLVYIPFNYLDRVDHTKEIIKYKNAGYDIILHGDYDLKKENPDVAVYAKPYDQIPKEFYIKEVQKVVQYCILSTYSMAAVDSNNELIRLSYKLPMHTVAWKQLSYSKQYSDLMEKYSYNDGKNLLKIGHPRFDSILTNQIQDKEFAKLVLQKSNGRKVFLWNSHHTIDKEGFSGTFLKWGNKIINYFANNSSVFLLWRPHPLFYDNLKRELNFTNEENLLFWDNIKSYENILIDNTPSYITSVNISDALISDVSSLIDEYVISEKPVLLLKKETTKNNVNSKYEDVLYLLEELVDIEVFVNNVVSGTDPLLPARKRFASDNYYLPNKGTTVAKCLLDIIVNDLKSNENENVLELV